ncbi:hypothetical protein AYO47_03495 [Planctomyces sp. SCGC AG-212-M04]|nr:hypothetical protein AYO47_03495 [Planctomyces sp. SCGC AG-212-M04]
MMIDTSPKPKRGRWRWLVASLVLLAIVVTWRLWPRSDARVLGKWLEPTGKTMILSDDGLCEVDGRRAEFRWWVSGSYLMVDISTRSHRPLERALAMAARLAPSSLASTISPKVGRWLIDDVEPDSFTISDVTGRKFVHTRLPE